jgi:5'-methylthioadenosine nucleosidase
VTTSNSLDHNEQDDAIMFANDAHVKDMEAAGIAWVIENYFMAHWNEHHCQSVDSAVLPFFAVKVVTDIVDGSRPTHEEFMENLGTAAASLHTALDKIMDFLKGKKLTDL